MTRPTAGYGFSSDEISGVATFLLAKRKGLRLTPTRRVKSSNSTCVVTPRKSAEFYLRSHSLFLCHKTRRLLLLSVNFPQFTT